MNTVQLNSEFTDALVRGAVEVCAQKKFSGNLNQALQLLRSRQGDVSNFVADQLARELGGYLGKLDKTIKAVYLYEPEEISIRPLEGGQRTVKRKTGVNLVLWVNRKNAALKTLSETFINLLSKSWRDLDCPDAVPLDIQMVDDVDVRENRGYGMLVNSMFVRSLPVWKRSEQIDLPEDDIRGAQTEELQQLLATFDPELIPESVLLERAQAIERLNGVEQEFYDHHLQDIRVSLIRRMLSDQLAYINIAKKWLSFGDLRDIYQRKIGKGRIGGKAAGLILAKKILHNRLPEDVLARIHVPQSWFLGSDINYIFMAMNGLSHWVNQKYKNEEQIWGDYPAIQQEFQAGEFPPEVITELEKVLQEIGKKPLIVRSSSQLEDNFGTAFAGKYESYFLANQAEPEENLRALQRAVAGIFASTLKPDALLYRRSKGLQDYDERMGVLIQEVQGETYGRYYLPYGAGVAFSRNLYRWAPQIVREDGFMRLVWGLGTRAVERLGDDFPRLVALSHPSLQPDDSPEATTYYSQRQVDVIDLQENRKVTLPVREILKRNYQGLQMMAEISEDGYYRPLRRRLMEGEEKHLALTYSELLRRTKLAVDMRTILKSLEDEYEIAIDMEFTIALKMLSGGEVQTQISVLQCRPQSHLVGDETVLLPQKIDASDLVIATEYMVPHGYVKDIEYVVYVAAEKYFALPSVELRRKVGHLIGRINQKMRARQYICVGPGRWGTTNHDLGVFVAYGDIDKAGALVEICGAAVGVAPEPSLGTHFFQDLMEGGVYPVAVNLDEQDAVIQQEFFEDSTNCLDELLDGVEDLHEVVKLVRVDNLRPGYHLDLIMDNEKGKAVAVYMKS